MTPDTPHPRIVVGYDGSAVARAALSMAVARARPGGRVVVVHAFDLPDGRYDGVSHQRQLDAAFDRARSLLANLPEEFPGLGSLDWSTEVLAGPAARSIAAVADVEHASEIVIGSRGLGRARALLGSVSYGLIHRAGCPVTVVPERALPLDVTTQLTSAGADVG